MDSGADGRLMNECRLIRVAETRSETSGIFVVDDKLICASLELPWEGNQRNISRIPKGLYEVVKETSDRLGKVFRILDVPGRTNVLIHSANSVSQLRGCIAPGMTIWPEDGVHVYDSKTAINALYKYLPNTFILKVEENFELKH